MFIETFSVVLYKWLRCHLSKLSLTGPEAISIDVMKQCEVVAPEDNKYMILDRCTME